jgi:hypothetical protein
LSEKLLHKATTSWVSYPSKGGAGMSDLNEHDEIELQRRAASASREYRYEQMRKNHTVCYLNYAPGCDPTKDEPKELTGPQIQLSFDMGYRLAMKQVSQYIDKFWYFYPNQSKEEALQNITSFTNEHIEDSFCLNYFDKPCYEKLHEQLLKHKEAFEGEIAVRNWIE